MELPTAYLGQDYATKNACRPPSKDHILGYVDTGGAHFSSYGNFFFLETAARSGQSILPVKRECLSQCDYEGLF